MTADLKTCVFPANKKKPWGLYRDIKFGKDLLVDATTTTYMRLPFMGKKQYVVHIYTQHCREWFYICFSGLDTYRNIRSYASFVPNGVTCLCYCSHVVISISNGPEGWIWLYYTSIYFFVVYTLHKFTTAWINIYGRGRCSSDVGKWSLNEKNIGNHIIERC